MILKRLEIYNFIVFEDVSLDLGEDVFFITGQNNDKMSSSSNGAGKSTLCQAIVWCLFDDILRKGLLKDGVIGPHDEFCRVVLTVEQDGKEITIDRVRKHPDRGNDVKLIIDGEDKSLHSTADTNQYIERLLNINSKIVYYCAYADESKEPLVSLTSSALHKVVSEILDTQRFDTYLKEVRSFKKQAERDYEAAVEMASQKGEQLDICNNDIEFIEQQIESFEKKQQERIAEIKQRIEELEKEAEEYKQLLEKKPAVEEELRLLSRDVKHLELLNRELKKRKQSKGDVEKRYNNALKKLHMAEAELEKAEEAYDNIFNNVSGQCQFCGNILHDSASLDDYANQIATRRDNAQADLIDIRVDTEERKKTLDSINGDIEAYEKEIEAGQEKLDRYNALKNKLSSFEQIEQGLDYILRTIRKAGEELRGVKAESSITLKKQLKDKQELLTKLKKDIKVYLDKTSQSEKEAKACSYLEDAVKRTKTGVFNSFVMELQDRINDNFEQMTSGEYHCAFHDKGGELAMVFTDSSKGDAYLPFSVFSKGERARISKAAAMALNDMLNVGFMIDDEGLEGLDAEGSGSILDFVLSKAGGKTLFFCSHQDTIKDYFTGFKNLHVTKEHGCSTVEVKGI